MPADGRRVSAAPGGRCLGTPWRRSAGREQCAWHGRRTRGEVNDSIDQSSGDPDGGNPTPKARAPSWSTGSSTTTARALPASPRGGVRWKLTGAVRNRTKVKRRKAGARGRAGCSQRSPKSVGRAQVVATVSYEVLRFLPREIS